MLLMVKASGVKSLMRTPSSQTCSATRNALEEKIKVIIFTPSPSPAHLVSDRKHGRSSFFIFSTSISLSVSSLAVYLRYGRKTCETWCTIIMGFCHSTTRKNTQMQTIWDSHLAFHHPKKIFCLAVVDRRNHDFSLESLVTQIPGGV